MSGEPNTQEPLVQQCPMCGAPLEGLVVDLAPDGSGFDSARGSVLFVAGALVLGMVPDLLWNGIGLWWVIQNFNEWLTLTVSAHQIISLISELLRLTCMGVAAWGLWRYADVLHAPPELTVDAVPFAPAHLRLAQIAAGCLGVGCILDVLNWLT